MKKEGLSIPQLARMAGTHNGVLYYARRGRMMTTNTLEKIANALDADIDRLARLRALLPAYIKYMKKPHISGKHKRKPVKIICEYCHKPGIAKGWAKYPHEECKKAVIRIKTVHSNKRISHLENRKKRKKRLCLRCDNFFNSAGPHNRICGCCKTTSQGEPIRHDIPVHKMHNHGGHHYVSSEQ